MHSTHVRLGFVGRVLFTLAVAVGGTGTLLYAAVDGAQLSLSRTPAAVGALVTRDVPAAPALAAPATACVAARQDVC